MRHHHFYSQKWLKTSASSYAIKLLKFSARLMNRTPRSLGVAPIREPAEAAHEREFERHFDARARAEARQASLAIFILRR